MSTQLNSPSDKAEFDELNQARIESNSLATTLSIQAKQLSAGSCHQLTLSPNDKTRFFARCLPSPSISQRLANRMALRMQLDMDTQSISKNNNTLQSPKSKKEAELGLDKTVSVSMKKKRKYLMEIESGCSICLQPFGQTTGKLPCSHEFCFQCIEFWGKSSTKCPYCRKQFEFVTKSNGEKVSFQAKQLQIQDSDDYIQDPCYVCNTFDDIPTLLLCDKCQNKCCHIHCDPRIIDTVPDYWICAMCEVANQESNTPNKTRSNMAEDTVSEKASRSQRYNLRNRQRIGAQPLGVTLRPRPKRGRDNRDVSRMSMVTRQNARRRRR